MNENNLVELISFHELNSRLAATYEQTEGMRKSFVSTIRRRLLIWMPIVAVVEAVVMGLLYVNPWAILISVAISMFIVYAIVISSPAKAYSRAYKGDVIGGFVCNLLEDGQYSPGSGISERAFVESGLFSTRPDRYSCEDLISGRAGKTQIHFSEVHAEEKYYTTDSKGNRRERWRDIFKGIIFVADFNKNFTGHTLITRKSMFNFGGGDKVRMEDPAFNKKFEVRSTDQIEARYIITPAMMSRIMELNTAFKGKGLRFSFLNSSVMMAVSDGVDYFESSIWRRTDDPRILQREYNLICAFANVVNTMNLNVRIWGK